ncbi:MAG: AtpZ/AtpI family protein [Proteobacteria bacterium]|nr:AtpZ/AtpI family protein [Pseudomonadota bacterium]
MVNKKSGMMKAMKYSVIGIEMAASVTVGGLIGYWLDTKLGTDPWMFVFWLICGLVAGFRSLYRMSKQFLKESKQNENQGSD